MEKMRLIAAVGAGIIGGVVGFMNVKAHMDLKKFEAERNARALEFQYQMALAKKGMPYMVCPLLFTGKEEP